MARKITISDIRKAVDEIPDEEFFTSVRMAENINTMIGGVTEKYDAKYRVQLTPNGEYVAYTDGNTITVNVTNPLVQAGKTKEEKYYILLGIVLHECAHLLYTNFKLGMEVENKLIENEIYPLVPIGKPLEEVFDAKKGGMLVRLYHNFDNCIEDGHIEQRVMNVIPGYGECLELAREIQLNDYDFDDEDEDIDLIGQLINATLLYAKYGIREEVLPDSMAEAIAEAVEDNDSFARKEKVNTGFDILVSLIKDLIPDNPPSGGKGGSSDKSDSKGKSKDEGESSSSSSKDDSDDSSKSTGSESSDSSESDSDSSKSGSGSSDGDEDGENEDDADAKDSGSKGSADSEGDSKDSGSKGKDAASADSDYGKKHDHGTGDTFGDDSISDAERLEKALKEALDKLSDKFEDKSEHKNTDEHPVGDAKEPKSESKSKSLAKDFKDLSEKVGTEKIEQELVSTLHKRLKKKANTISEERKHLPFRDRGDNEVTIMTPSRIPSSAKALYNEKHQELDLIAKRCVKNLDKVIKERVKGDMETGLYSGKYLDSAHCYRSDRKIMSNKILPEKTPDMEIVVLVDCSGSMSGERMTHAVDCAYVTYKFCNQMGIPCTVFGHTTAGGSDLPLIRTVAHPSFTKEHCEQAIFTLIAERNNRDGWALRFCQEYIKDSLASKKMILVISDGAPCASGYGDGRAEREDLQDMVRVAKKKGIVTVVAGISYCSSEIHDVYIEGVSRKEAATFLDFEDMSGLPKAFANVIRRELL